MARIVVPAAGNVIVGPVDAPRSPAGAFDRGGRALAEIGRVGVEIAGTAMADQLRREEEQARVARRVAAVNAKVGIDNSLAELADKYRNGILDGSIDAGKADAEFAREARERIAGHMAGLHPDDAALLQAESGAVLGRARNAIGDAVVRYNQRTILGGLLTAEEQFQRAAARDRQAAVRQFEQTLEVLGPQAGLLPDQIAARRQQFRERVAFEAGAQLVRDARDDIGALDAVQKRIASDEFADLDPTRRGQLEAQVLARKQYLQNQAEIAARRAEAQRERQLREAEHAVNAVQKLVDNGAYPDVATVAQAQAFTRGTPYDEALTALIAQGRERAGFASLPPERQQATLLALRAQANQQGSSPALEQRIATFERIHRESEQALRNDPLMWGVNRRIIDQVQPLAFTSLADLAAGLGGRMQQAMQVSAYVGQPVSPLLQSEAERVAQLLKVAPVEQRAAAINALASQVSDPGMVRALAVQVAGKDQTLATAIMLAADGNKTTKGRTVTELYLRGAEVIATKANKGENDREMRAAATIRGNIVQAIGDAYFSPQARDLYVDAAVKIQAALKAEGASNTDEVAVALATGGIVNRNGRPVVKPYGWSDRDFDRWVESVQERLKSAPGSFFAGGAMLTGQQLAAALPGARMASVGAGQYVLVGPGGQVVRQADGTPLVLDAQR